MICFGLISDWKLGVEAKLVFKNSHLIKEWGFSFETTLVFTL